MFRLIKNLKLQPRLGLYDNQCLMNNRKWCACSYTIAKINCPKSFSQTNNKEWRTNRNLRHLCHSKVERSKECHFQLAQKSGATQPGTHRIGISDQLMLHPSQCPWLVYRTLPIPNQCIVPNQSPSSSPE
jgi:hypothetical protein